MCDTAVIFNRDNNSSYFMKNSDRHPSEIQFIHLCNNAFADIETYGIIEQVDKYYKRSYKALKDIFYNFENRYKAIISRPKWIWGAEMGVNEFGLVIGNEAVFSTEKVPAKGLLGMDILRLALHNKKTAKEALDFIINIITYINQGGDGGYKGTLKYFNSFLIKDFKEAYVLETSGKHWAYKKVENKASISNCYTLTDDYDNKDKSTLDSNFKKEYEDSFMTFLTMGNSRQKKSYYFLKEIDDINLKNMQNLSRWHINKKDKIKYGMNSICMHSGPFIKSQTTSSMIVQHIEDKFIVWFTGSPFPCISLYKPIIISKERLKNPFNNINYSLEYSRKKYILAHELVKNKNIFKNIIKNKRDYYEKKFEEIVIKNIKNLNDKQLNDRCLLCYEMEKEYELFIREQLK